MSDGSQDIHDNPSSSRTEQNSLRSDAKFNYENSVNGQVLHRDYLDVHIHQGEDPQTMISSSAGETQVVKLRILSFTLNILLSLIVV